MANREIQIQIHKSFIHRTSISTSVVLETKLETTLNFLQLGFYGLKLVLTAQ